MANLLYFAALILFYSSHVNGRETFVKSIAKCPVENPPDVEIDLVSVGDALAMNMKAKYDYDIDENYKLQMQLYKQKGGNWEYNSYYEDRWCAVMLNIAKPWNLAKAAIHPPLPEGCTIPEGEYNLDEFQLKNEDVASIVQPLDPGKYKADVVLAVGMPPDKEEVLCVTVEFDIEA